MKWSRENLEELKRRVESEGLMGVDAARLMGCTPEALYCATRMYEIRIKYKRRAWNRGIPNPKAPGGWNRGLTKESDARVASVAQKLRKKRGPCPELCRRKISEAQRGKVISLDQRLRISSTLRRKYALGLIRVNPWNAGLTKETNDSLRKESEWLKREYAEGRLVNQWKGRHHTLENRTLFSRNTARMHAEGRFRKENTDIERAMDVILVLIGVPFKKQFLIDRVVADFAFPDLKLIIECDGGYWHTIPKTREKDIRRDCWLRGQGWSVLRFTDSEIKKSPELCQERIVSELVARGALVQASL